MTDRSVLNSGEQAESESLSTSLLERVRSHDGQAWRRMVRLFAPLVWSWCRRAGFQPADAEDFGQEVFLAVYGGIATYQKDGKRGSFHRWLRTITNNKIRDRNRDLAQGKNPGQVAAGGSDAAKALQQLPFKTLDDDADAHERENEVLFHRAMDVIREHFAENTWNAFYQQVIIGRKPADVAEDLNMSRDAVYLAKSRVLKRLRDEFDDLGIH